MVCCLVVENDFEVRDDGVDVSIRIGMQIVEIFVCRGIDEVNLIVVWDVDLNMVEIE